MDSGRLRHSPEDFMAADCAHDDFCGGNMYDSVPGFDFPGEPADCRARGVGICMGTLHASGAFQNRGPCRARFRADVA